jgi:hypothetical protein
MSKVLFIGGFLLTMICTYRKPDVTAEGPISPHVAGWE